VPGNGPKLLVRLIVPSRIAPSRKFTIWVEYANAGDVDMIPLCCGYKLGRVPLSDYPDDATAGSTLQILGVSFSGPPGVLRPGVGQSVPLYTKSMASDGGIDFNLDSWRRKRQYACGKLERSEAAFKPQDIDPNLWSDIWAALTARRHELEGFLSASRKTSV